MYTLSLHPDAQADLQQLLVDDRKNAVKTLAILQEIKGNQDLLDRLSQHDFDSHSDPHINVSRFQEHWRRGKNLWRLKFWDMEGRLVRHRLIYAYNPQTDHYCVLGVLRRDDVLYRADDPRTQRILAAYESLGIKHY